MGGVKRGSKRPGWKIPNGMFAQETPQLTDVSVYVPADLGRQNLESVMIAMSNFWLNRDVDRVVIPGHRVMGGNLYGKRRHINGEYFYTDEIMSMRRLETGEPKDTRFPRDVLCAETRGGETFFFYGDMFSLHLLIMMGDALDNCLKEERGYYQHPDYRSNNYY